MTGLLGDSKDLKKVLGGEPEFPGLDSIQESGNGICGVTDKKGLTKREYFAGLAMQGFVQKNITLFDDTNVHELRAKWSVEQADALLQELERAALPEEKV